MSVLSGLQPERVFHYFEELTKIPHGSGNTKQISDFCVEFAKAQNLEWYQDGDNNVVIIKEATKGYEESDALIIQGHLDMVCEKESGCPKNMDTEGLDIYVDGDLVKAKQTTLGGDDGIAVAMAMAILEDKTLRHPRLEVVFTTDEETGMFGAMALDVSPLKGKMLLNIDSEVEGIFTVSCAGGNLATCKLPLTGENVTKEGVEIKIKGLVGGHSGVEIDKNRANANMLMGRFLQAIAMETPMQIATVEGGLKNNAIPAEAKAVVVADETVVKKLQEEYIKIFQNEYKEADKDITITVDKVSLENEFVADAETTEKMICLLTCAPNGILTMSQNIEGLVQTSLNLGILTTNDKEMEMCYCVRSSVESERVMINRRLASLMKQIGGTFEQTGDYPGWEYNPNSVLRENMVALYKEMFEEEPKIEAIHAGLECGLFAGKIEGLDCISIGPNLYHIHTPREAMSISSVERVYGFVLELLKRMKD